MFNVGTTSAEFESAIVGEGVTSIEKVDVVYFFNEHLGYFLCSLQVGFGVLVLFLIFFAFSYRQFKLL